jgi:hypothetical protein
MCISRDLNFSKIRLRSLAGRSLEYAQAITVVLLLDVVLAAQDCSKYSNNRTSRVVDSADLVKTSAFATERMWTR